MTPDLQTLGICREFQVKRRLLLLQDCLPTPALTFSLLGIIHSWDGNDSNIGGQFFVGDFFNISVDGQSVFRQPFDTFDPTDGYVPPPNGLLANDYLFSIPSSGIAKDS